ncbi:hypothetical protein ACGFYU_31830 [Streptomyces sp. NPDC048337]|uniref:hypothetical protein n=1 Tax=Streptomyces sp. NPDC048337 TaxID=3365535 RepID=UPI0037101CAB
MKRSLIMTTAAAFTGLALAVTGCSAGNGSGSDKGSSGGGGNGPSAQQIDDALKLRKCLRENGIDAPDPAPGQDPRGLALGGDVDQGKLQEAMKTCGAQGPGGGNGITQEQKDLALKQAQCMRANGVNVKDPEFRDNGMTPMEVPKGQEKAFEEAMKKCEAAR